MTRIDDRHISKARKVVVRRFPEMDGAELSVSEKRAQSKRSRSEANPTGSQSHEQFLLIFKRDVPLPGGHRLKRLVRVTMDESGEIIKVSSSK